METDETWSSGARRISRRSLLAGAAGIGAGLALAGCGGSGAKSGGAASNKFEMWIWETSAQWQQVVKQSGLNAKFPGVDFSFTALAYEQLAQKSLTSLGAGVAAGLPSIIRIQMIQYRALVQTKSLTDFTDIVNQHKADILPGVYEGLLVDDKIYAMPDDTGVMLFGYRRDIFAKAGLPTTPAKVESMLATYDGLLAIGAKLKSIGVKLFNDPTDQMFNNIILQDTTGYFDKDGNVIFDSEQHIACAQLAKKFYDSGYVATFEDGSPQMWSAYKQGKIATMFYPNWTDFLILQNAPATKDQWNVVKLPAVMSGGKRASSADGCALVVPSVLPDAEKQRAIEVATYLNLTKEPQVAHMKVFDGAFVSYQPALEAMSNVKSPVLNNQYTYKVDLDNAQNEKILPWYRTSVFWADATNAVADAMVKITKQNAPIPATLKSAADSIRSLQSQRGVK